jgi:hypothetical protein
VQNSLSVFEGIGFLFNFLERDEHKASLAVNNVGNLLPSPATAKFVPAKQSRLQYQVAFALPIKNVLLFTFFKRLCFGFYVHGDRRDAQIEFVTAYCSQHPRLTIIVR